MTKEELEKEAEEKYCKGCKLRIEQCLWTWRNTNGMNEPNEKNCSCKEVPTYIAGAEFGYNKANEWHYVKDGDLPKVGVQVLSEKGTLVIYKGEGFNWVEYSPNADNIKLRKWEEPIAWKEIVLPELKESE